MAGTSAGPTGSRSPAGAAGPAPTAPGGRPERGPAVTGPRGAPPHPGDGAHDVKGTGRPPDPDDDYPLIARILGDAIVKAEVERGIFCCGSGIGPVVALNKMHGVRAALVDNEWSARDAVTHVNVNVLTVGERVIGEELAKSLVDAFLSAIPEEGRHARRRKQIDDLEAMT